MGQKLKEKEQKLCFQKNSHVETELSFTITENNDASWL